MRILYLTRPSEETALRHFLQEKIGGRTHGQNGFFEASLFGSCEVHEVSFRSLMQRDRFSFRNFDAIIINAKFHKDFDGNIGDLIRKLSFFSGPLALFIPHAHPAIMPEDSIVDHFHAVFKREPYFDLDKYKISVRNQDKITATHLANPFISHSKHRGSKDKGLLSPRFGWQHKKIYDVSFLGSDGGQRFKNRIDIWKSISVNAYRTFGGLTVAKDSDLEESLRAARLSKSMYIKGIARTKVNLALSGHGPFTFRHLELLWAGAFMLCEGVIREQRLRAPLVEGHDYISFDSISDLHDKISFFLDRDTERDKIAKNGRAAYDRLYDVEAHGREILAALTA